LGKKEGGGPVRGRRKPELPVRAGVLRPVKKKSWLKKKGKPLINRKGGRKAFQTKKNNPFEKRGGGKGEGPRRT